MILVLAAGYSAMFLLLGWKYPKIPLFLIFAFAPFQNDIYDMATGQDPMDPNYQPSGGPKFSLAEISLALTFVLFLLKRPNFNLGPLKAPMIFYLAVGFLFSLFNWRSGTMVSLIQTGLYYVIAVMLFAHFAKKEDDYRLALNGLICVTVVIGAVAVASRQMYILGLHKNGVGSSMACATIVCAEMFFANQHRRQKWFYAAALLVIVGGLLFSFSRGSWLGAMAGLCVIFAMRRQFKLILQCGLLAIPVIAILWQTVPEEQRAYATSFDKKRVNINARYEMVEYARDQYLTSPVIGVGVGLRKEYDATNLFWLTLAETGPVGVFAIGWIHFAFLRMVWTTQKRLNRSTLQYSLLAVGGALVVSRMAHGMVDHYWTRGAIVMAWASAGMALHTHLATKKKLKRRRLQRMLAAQAEAETDSSEPIAAT